MQTIVNIYLVLLNLAMITCFIGMPSTQTFLERTKLPVGPSYTAAMLVSAVALIVAVS